MKKVFHIKHLWHRVIEKNIYIYIHIGFFKNILFFSIIVRWTKLEKQFFKIIGIRITAKEYINFQSLKYQKIIKKLEENFFFKINIKQILTFHIFINSSFVLKTHFCTFFSVKHNSFRLWKQLFKNQNIAFLMNFLWTSK